VILDGELECLEAINLVYYTFPSNIFIPSQLL